ncbi:MAG TPA: glycosyltransferase family 2 protein [Ramlibacter sp.]|nr:glycosyltransferase family 2 protein [Ramlibacter sp.]
MIFTLNEEVHLPSCLDSLDWCDDVIVIDSFSTDNTCGICKQRGVRLYQNRFEGFGSQRNWALDHAQPKHPWILVLDADERVPAALAQELGDIAIRSPADVGAYRVRRRFHMWGRWLRYSSLYPTWVVRFIHRERVRYVDRGHAETQHVAGAIGDLGHDLIDENLKGIGEWFERQNRYAGKDAAYELREQGAGIGWRELFSSDPLRRRTTFKRLAWRVPARGLVYFLYSYLWRGGFRDGRDGLMFCRMRALYQAQIAIRKYDAGRRDR